MMRLNLWAGEKPYLMLEGVAKVEVTRIESDPADDDPIPTFSRTITITLTDGKRLELNLDATDREALELWVQGEDPSHTV
jgi:hypothetical protein